MVESGGITELANQSLDLVGRELHSTLDAARAEIEDYVDGQTDAEALVRAASMLHLAAGALKLVEIHSAALLAEEMEEVCRVLTGSGDHELIDRGVGALTRAMVQLPAYLDRLLAGSGDVALVLLPVVNELREIRGRPLMSEGTLLLLNSGPFERAGGRAAAGDATADYGADLARLAQAVRPSFQTALLGLIRGSDAPQNLARLIEICEQLAGGAGSDAAKEFWSVVGGVLVALNAGGLDASVTLKRLIGQADRQLKRLIDAGEADFARNPPADLLNSLLYYIARARSNDTRLVALREQFELAEFVPGDDEIERARETLSGPSVKLMQTVAMAIAEDLATVKDALDIFVRTGMADASGLTVQVDLLRKIGDTLGVLGLEAAQAQIHREAQALDAAIASDSFEESAVLESMAATLLDVEDTLGRELMRVAAPQQADDDAADDGDDDSTHYRHVMQAVMGECIVNLAKIKDAVIRIVEDPSAVRLLDQIEPQLRGITAGLLMLNKTRAVRVVERVGSIIATRLTHDGQVLKQAHLERLADAIVSVEYYMETLSVGRADPWYMLDNAQRCLDLLERLPGREAQADGEPASSERADTSEMEAKPAPAAAAGEPLSVMEVDEERSEPELVEIFIEEAKEEIANVRRLLPVWLDDTSQNDALVAIRRSFHTLKGSGRMVGARLIGEFAWNVENLLNRLINQTLAAKPEVLAFLSEASRALPALVEQLEIGTVPKLDIDHMMARAMALAEDRSLEGGRSAAAQDAGAGDTQGFDPVLIEIFTREVRTHLDTLRAYLGDPAGPGAVDDSVYRAGHTLLGSARMANVAGAMTVAGPLEKLFRRLHEQQAAPGSEVAGLIAAAADEFERLAGALDDGDPFEPDESLVRSLERAAAEPDASPAGADRGMELSSVDLADGGDDDDVAAPADEAYDPDIAAIFAEEATELLEAAETALQDLAPGADAGQGLRELQRLLHTIKGGARMAGVMAMGDLSHSLESLLAGMVDRRIEFTPEALGLVRESLDQLQQMRDAVDAGHRVAPAPVLVDLVERCARGERRSGLSDNVELATDEGLTETTDAYQQLPGSADETDARPDDDVDGDSPGESDSDDGTAIRLALVGDDFAEADEPVPQAPVAESAATGDEASDDDAAGDAMPGDADAGRGDGPEEPESAPLPPAVPETPARPAAEPAPVAAAAAPPRTQEKTDTARVNAELLDELLNQAGEISIFQSRLTQQLHSIDFHLGELGQTVTRLREQLRSLESETEAQILHRHQDDDRGQTDFDPLELDRYSTIQQLSRALAETSNDVASINELLSGLTSETDTLLTQQTRVTSELQDGLMHTRMVPMNRQVPRLGRIVRQAASDTGKRAELTVEGADSQLDRQVLDSILPALEHILRNAVAHGIESPARRTAANKPETGSVRMQVRRDGAEVIIDVSDDGAGLNVEAIRRRAIEQGLIDERQPLSDDEAVDMILRPGFTTADRLTQAAGRGVGMDVVDNEIKKLGGSMRIETTAGKGTRFVIRLPFTLAITHALIVRVGDETFALPLPTVEGITRVRREQLLEILTLDNPVLRYGEVNYRVQHLGSLVGAAPSALPEDDSAVSLVLVRAGENSAALLTDSLEGSREIVVKTLGAHLASVPGVSGATILGDGRVCVILDAPTLVRSGGDQTREPAPVEPVERQLAALVVDDSITMRRVTQRLLERRGMRVLTARDGLDAIEVLQEHDVDVIVLDIEMPRMDGYQFASHVRNDARLKDLPIIMVTSRSGEKHRAKAIEVGVNDYLSKPYQEAHLIRAIESLLGTSL